MKKRLSQILMKILFNSNKVSKHLKFEYMEIKKFRSKVTF